MPINTPLNYLTESLLIILRSLFKKDYANDYQYLFLYKILIQSVS